MGDVVVVGVGADHAEDPVEREPARGLLGRPAAVVVRHVDGPPALRRPVRVGIRRQVLVHPVGSEDVRAVQGEGVAQGLGNAEADGEGDAAVWRSVGEQFRHVVGRALPLALLGDDLLEQAAADQAAHRVGDQVDPRCAGALLEVLDQPEEVLGGVLQAERLGFAAPGAGAAVVEAVDPDAVGADVLGVVRQIGLLAALDEDAVALVGEQAH